ncbi:hypothetical protein ACFL1M_04580 [Patescibacteria group bacterium]
MRQNHAKTTNIRKIPSKNTAQRNQPLTRHIHYINTHPPDVLHP